MFCASCGGPTTEETREGTVRPVCTVCGRVTYVDPKLAVAVVIEREERILLGLRAAHTREPGKWSFPAGFVDRGEVVEAAALREVAEETGLHVDLSPVLALLSTEGDPVVLAVYAATSVVGTARAGDDMVELGWFAPDSLPSLAFDHDQQIVSTWQNWRASRATV